MANELDEITGPKSENIDARVIGKQLPVVIGTGSKIFDVIWWIIPPIIGGIIWSIMKAKAKSHFAQLQQKIQHDASQIDNYLEQRVQILKNCSKLVEKAIDLDKSTFTQLAALRSGKSGAEADEARNDIASKLDAMGKSINVAVESYPDLRAHQELADAMQQNAYLQREITAARELYNDSVNCWNRDIYAWPTKQIVAAQQGYTTRIPFTIDTETRQAARGDFF